MAAIAALGCIAASLLTYAVILYARANGMIDVPNARSSHIVPTPRGGGLSIAVVVFTGTLVLWAVGLVPMPLTVALVGGGTLIATIGWLDDRHGLSRTRRAAAHVTAAVWAVGWLGGLPIMRFGAAEVELGMFGGVIAVVGVVWLTNLYNFMDGIDGIAASEAVAVGATSAVMLTLGGDVGLASVAALVAGAAGGFLVWNWPPAHIFMGDVGSGLLGYLFAVLALACERASSLPLVLWLVLLLAFIGDATLTLIRRASGGSTWYEAHRTHAYQRAVQAGLSHSAVTGIVVAVNALLGGLAFLAWRLPAATPVVLAVAATLVGFVYLFAESRAHP